MCVCVGGGGGQLVGVEWIQAKLFQGNKKTGARHPERASTMSAKVFIL